MKTFITFIQEENEKPLTKEELLAVEKFADKLFSVVNVDVEFSKHFIDRVNDKRNNKQITSSELIRLFKQTFKKYGQTISKMKPNSEAVLNDLLTDLNLPFVVKWDGKELDMISKTIMRKKNFKTSNTKLQIR